MRRCLAVFVLLAACGEAAVVTSAPAPVDGTVATSPATSSATTAALATTVPADPPPPEEEAAAFLAAVDAELVDTVYAGEALNAPEVFLATGHFFCDQLDEGAMIDDILTDYVQEVSGVSIDDAPDDDLVLAGSILGAGVGHLCPDHQVTVGS